MGRGLLPSLLAVLALGLQPSCDSGSSSFGPVDEVIRGEAPCQELRLERPASQGNLVILLNDTMRRDASSVYGGPARTPRLEAFADEHLVFENAVSQAPWTKPSVASLFTSLYPSQHRVASSPQIRDRRNRKGQGELLEADRLAPSLETLAERLRAGGLRTAGFTTNPWMESRFGFDQGFEVYDDSFARWGAPGEEVVDAGLRWLDGLDEGERYFLYLHTIDSHRPYGRLPLEGLEELRQRLNLTRRLQGEEGVAIARSVRVADGRRAVELGFHPTVGLVREAYAAGVVDFDAVVGRLLDALSAREDWPRTAVLVTSDHGEALFDRGYGNHGGALFDDEAAVPLVARLPGVDPGSGRVACLVGLVDLMPSLCDYLDLACPAGLQGWSFLVRPDGGSDSRFLVTEGVMDRPGDRSIRNRRYKLIGVQEDGAREYSLFDLAVDPRERYDRMDVDAPDDHTRRVFGALRDQLPVAVAELPPPDGAGEVVPVDEELRSRLEALGYTE